jgi:hypothetical protein
VRPQPRQRPVRPSTAQTLMQGEEMAAVMPSQVPGLPRFRHNRISISSY